MQTEWEISQSMAFERNCTPQQLTFFVPLELNFIVKVRVTVTEKNIMYAS